MVAGYDIDIARMKQKHIRIAKYLTINFSVKKCGKGITHQKKYNYL